MENKIREKIEKDNSITFSILRETGKIGLITNLIDVTINETKKAIIKNIDDFIKTKVGYGGPTTRKFEELKMELEK